MSGVMCGAYHGFCRLRPARQKITQKFDGFLLRPGACDDG
jgi:hypothetical protein